MATTDPTPDRQPPVPESPALETDLAEGEPLSFGRRSARVLAAVVMLCIAALWVYTLWGPTKKTPPGILADPTWAAQAQVICTRAAAAIEALPPAYSAEDAPERAEVIGSAGAALRTMLMQLEAIAPPPDRDNDGRMIGEWLADWRIYMGDRDRYVAALEADAGARFYVTEKVKGQQITKPIDFFATYNDMPNCVTPGDLG